MPRTWTEEQKQAARERLAQAREAKKTKSENKTSATQEPIHQEIQSSEVNVSDLQRQIEELKQAIALNSAYMQGHQSAQGGNGTQVTNGRLIGTTEKYSTDPSRYPDPRQALASEPRLARIAFDQNYELNWEVSTTQYETKDGLSMKEPKFSLSLVRIVLDDDGEPTTGRYGICRLVFFEDPQTAIVTANQYGLPVDETNEADFLNEMRYLRMRDWLLECFWPKNLSSTSSKHREMAVGGKIVDYYEVSSEGNAKIPFGELTSKV